MFYKGAVVFGAFKIEPVSGVRIADRPVLFVVAVNAKALVGGQILTVARNTANRARGNHFKSMKLFGLWICPIRRMRFIFYWGFHFGAGQEK